MKLWYYERIVQIIEEVIVAVKIVVGKSFDPDKMSKWTMRVLGVTVLVIAVVLIGKVILTGI